MRIARLQVNHVTNPLGFYLGERPTFSWVVEEAKGTCAEASRVVVSCAGRAIVDTGWAELDAKAKEAYYQKHPEERPVEPEPEAPKPTQEELLAGILAELKQQNAGPAPEGK